MAAISDTERLSDQRWRRQDGKLFTGKQLCDKMRRRGKVAVTYGVPHPIEILLSSHSPEEKPDGLRRGVLELGWQHRHDFRIAYERVR